MSHKTLWPAMLYLAGILLVIGVAIAVIAAIRKWARAGQPEDGTEGLTLGQARQMKANGLLTDQEFDQIKRVIIASAASRPNGENAGSAL